MRCDAIFTMSRSRQDDAINDIGDDGVDRVLKFFFFTYIRFCLITRCLAGGGERRSLERTKSEGIQVTENLSWSD